MMTCPDCKTNVQSDMKYCPVCGSALALHAPVNSAIPSGIYLKWFDSFLKNSKIVIAFAKRFLYIVLVIYYNNGSKMF